MNYTKLLRAGVALAIGTSIAACSSHGSNGSPLPAMQQPASAKKASAKLSITIPHPGTSSATRAPKYISQNTKSASVVETDTGAAPQTTIADLTATSPNCTDANAGLTCSIDVAANPGNDTFTVTLFDGAKATGNPLSSGSFSANVVAGAANSFPLTLNGIVGKVKLAIADAYPVVGSTETVTVNVQDASGATIIGAFDAPVSITAPAGVTLSKTSIATSADNEITATSAADVTAPFALIATAANASDSVTVHPASGVVTYPIGNDPTNDLSGFPIVAGRDGNLYYGTIGTCDNSGCNAGTVGKFNPATGAFTEVPVGARVYGVTQTSDGAVWAGTNNGIMHFAPGNFSAAGLTKIALPAASNGTGSRIRRFAEVTSGGGDTLWFTDQTRARIGSINVAGPFDSTGVAMHILPNGPATGTMQRTASPNGIVQWSGDGNLYVVDYNNGLLDVVDPTNGSVLKQVILPEQIALGNAYGAFPRFITEGPDHKLYISESQQGLQSPFNGVLESYDAGGFAPVALPGYSFVPDDVAGGGSGATATVANVDLAAFGAGIYDVSTKSERYIPMGDQFSLQSSGLNPNGVAVANDGSVWFTSYGKFNGGPVLPLMLEHVVYTPSWSIYPRGSINLFGTGIQSGDLMGIVEHGNSGPFTVTSSDPNVASAQGVKDHNFMVVGNGTGSCVLTVTDAAKRSYSFTVNVTSTGGTVQSARRKAE